MKIIEITHKATPMTPENEEIRALKIENKRLRDALELIAGLEPGSRGALLKVFICQDTCC